MAKETQDQKEEDRILAKSKLVVMNLSLDKFLIREPSDCVKKCEEVLVVKRVHTLLGRVHRLATALQVVEEVQEEVLEIKDE